MLQPFGTFFVHPSSRMSPVHLAKWWLGASPLRFGDRSFLRLRSSGISDSTTRTRTRRSRGRASELPLLLSWSISGSFCRAIDMLDVLYTVHGESYEKKSVFAHMFWWEHKQSETSRVFFDLETHITGGTHMQPTIGMSIFGESGHGRTRLEFRSIATSCGEYFIIWGYICCENVVFYVSPWRPKCNYLFLVMCIVWSISFYFWLWHCLVLGCCFFLALWLDVPGAILCVTTEEAYFVLM